MTKYRVRRVHPNEYAQNQASTMKECKLVLRDLEAKWKPLVGNHNSGFGYDFRIERKPQTLTIFKQAIDTSTGGVTSETIIDEYITEEA